MIKHLAIPVLGLIVLAGAAAPAVADRGASYKLKSTPQYPYATTTKKAKSPYRSSQKKFNQSLDFETEAVWRNLRPSRFVD